MARIASDAIALTSDPGYGDPVSERIILEVVDGIAYATLNRPDKLNALDLPMFHALASVPGEIAKDRSVRAVVLHGAGKSFCSGLDIGSLGAGGGADGAAALLAVVARAGRAAA